MVEADWKKIKTEYIRGNTSYRKLAQKYGVSPSTLSKLAMKEKWADLRKRTGIKVDTKLSETVASQEAKRIDGIQTVADMLLEKIAQGVADGTYTVDSQSIRQITASIKDLREIKGLKSEIDLQEQLARIEKLRKEVRDETSESKEIKVVIATDLEEYSV